MPKFLTKIISTFFFVGYLPFMPGTFGSLAAILLYYLIRGDILKNVVLIFICATAGFLTAGRAEREVFKKIDPKYVVIDEVTGMLCALAFLPFNSGVIISAFILFRFFDTLKPYPLYRLQGKRGSLGIMADDIIAGVYTNIILQLFLRFASCRTS